MEPLVLFSIVSFSALTVVALLRWIILPRFQNEGQRQQTTSPQSIPVVEKDPYQAIEPLPDFDWRTVEPLRNAPLKSKYHLTMSIETITFSDLIAMDNTYEERTHIRRQIMDSHPEATIQCTPVCESAVLELTEWIFGMYLPTRFPKMFQVESDNLGKEKGRIMLNTVTNQHVPIYPSSATEALRSLGENVDTDFLLLLPRRTSPSSSSATDGDIDKYHLEAFVCCFPSGFSLREKLGWPLAAIHQPVPGNKAKLERSMDRFFARLECGKIVKRANWAVTTDEALFKEKGNHLYAGEHEEASQKGSGSFTIHSTSSLDLDAERSSVHIPDCRLRSERQTLFRLPRSRAIVFSFKTYLYLLEDVKREGYGEQLAQAIEGLEKGNVPEMGFYKRGVVWGDEVVGFLRS